ncbi:hypothetical protein EDD63_10263 [Breznakia blatticola]|uniref:Uncharacterized protein n=1 Tax=Breznakia blatticola TaxID=1754012 RepID=A0A4R8A602_9FIRM|nr:hypothetical protein [Breznakia blatticola]TDW26042.1 hypothetical protein EDD63_10263 [Breznakia blatticola]
MSGVSKQTKKLYLKKNRIIISLELNKLASQKMIQDVSQSILHKTAVHNIARAFTRHDLDYVSFCVDSTKDITYLTH